MQKTIALLLGSFIIFGLCGCDMFHCNNRLGKQLYITVDKDTVADYLFVEEILLWDEAERGKLANYMREENLVIAEGKYTLNQTTTFKEARKIFNLP